MTSNTSTSLEKLIEKQERIMEFLKKEDTDAGTVRVVIGVQLGVHNVCHENPAFLAQVNSFLERLYVLLESKLASRSEEI